MEKVYNIIVGGKAGEGVKKAAQVIAHIAMAAGKYVFQNDDYQSLIKGGHNFSLVSISDNPIYNSYFKVDIIISFDDRSIRTHRDKLLPGGLHFVNQDDAASKDEHMISLPLSSLMKKLYSNPANVSLAATGIFAALTGISQAELEAIVRKEYRNNTEENLRFAIAIYDLCITQKHEFALKLNYAKGAIGTFHSGNQLIALGALAQGLTHYFSYPMTPASSILHYLALKKESHKVYAVHAESELAAANMAIGAAFAGARTAVGSSGGGFALMQEAFSFAGMAEAPLLCFLSSRPGPATGVSTYTAQEDLFFALNQGHGIFPRIVASPDSFERAYSLSAELMELAWEYQSPAILLTEKHLSECSANIDLTSIALPKPFEQPSESEAVYKRYAITESGISPLKFPGKGNCSPDDVIKWCSHEHLETGVRTDEPDAMIAMKDKRLCKGQSLIEGTKKYQRVAFYGTEGPLVFAYGSTALELRELMKYYPLRLVVPIYLEPFPYDELAWYRGQEAIVVEHAAQPHFAEFLRQKLGIISRGNILRYDGRSWDTFELLNVIEELQDA
ncbi:MAG: 2-oxoacid:acceptor oxidoreductase family protein [Candidatus Cloacimonetes bacterium]|nr:2-oxoacid:acceptor oxidoreductase family protein [Candidatus Cloacimonadota bacterium]